MADHYKLETKGGRIWLRNAKNQVDKGTRIISKEPSKIISRIKTIFIYQDSQMTANTNVIL